MVKGTNTEKIKKGKGNKCRENKNGKGKLQRK